jgi:hypothetical protein
MHAPTHPAARERPRLCMNCVPLRSEGAGKTGRLMHPQPRVQDKKAHKRSHHRFTGSIRFSLRNGFNGFLRALPGDRAFLSPSSRGLFRATLHQRRDARTTRLRRPRNALVSRARRVHRVPPRVRDDREPPLVKDETGGFIRLILARPKAEYFLLKGWTLICPTGGRLLRHPAPARAPRRSRYSVRNDSRG